MGYLDERKVTVRDVLGESVAVAGQNWRVLAIYVAFFLGSTILIDIMPIRPPWNGLVGLMLVVSWIVAQALLFDALFGGRWVLLERRSRPYFRFAGMFIVVALAISIASSLFVIPAFILGGRWIAAPSYLVAGQPGTFSSLAQSWRRSEGNTFVLGLSVFLLALFWVLALFMVGQIEGALGWTSRLLGAQFIFSGTLPFVCMSVAVYRLLNGEKNEIVEVFA